MPQHLREQLVCRSQHPNDRRFDSRRAFRFDPNQSLFIVDNAPSDKKELVADHHNASVPVRATVPAKKRRKSIQSDGLDQPTYPGRKLIVELGGACVAG